MGNTSHFAGHRVADVSFQRGWVKCDCGKEFTVTLDPDLLISGQEALAETFGLHRRGEAAKARAKA